MYFLRFAEQFISLYPCAIEELWSKIINSLWIFHASYLCGYITIIIQLAHQQSDCANEVPLAKHKLISVTTTMLHSWSFYKFMLLVYANATTYQTPSTLGPGSKNKDLGERICQLCLLGITFSSQEMTGITFSSHILLSPLTVKLR